jgi:hypothetical protein
MAIYALYSPSPSILDLELEGMKLELERVAGIRFYNKVCAFHERLSLAFSLATLAAAKCTRKI